MGYMKQSDIRPITAKGYLIENWEKYGVADTKEDFIAFLNMLQACGENLDSLHNAYFNGHVEFCDIYHGKTWKSDREIADTLCEFCSFYTEKEFIDMILDRREDYESSQEWSESIYNETTDDISGDNSTQITKTDDGYVVRVWY
ncbi:MAG: hypothetical protein IKS98_08080 [Lachnospiraceae bacterium]|nr:hypothetical protein [Lachnospiraceae bacterium]